MIPLPTKGGIPMQKKIHNIRYVNLFLIFSFVFCLVVCLEKEKPAFSNWFTSLLVLGSEKPHEPNQDSEGNRGPTETNATQVYSFSPEILFENSNFEITGKNLLSLSEVDLFGENAKKMITFLESSNTKITAHVSLCPTTSFEIPIQDPKIGRVNQKVTCLGTFSYSRRSYTLDTNIAVTNMMPLDSNPSLLSLRQLGEIQFHIEPSLPEGLQFNSVNGNVSGIPIGTTNNEFQVLTVTASLKEKPHIKIDSQLKMIVLTPDERINRTCHPISATSTCNGPSPHVCSNVSKCFLSQFACLTDSKCGI